MMPFVPLCFIVDTAARARPTLKCSLGTFLFLRSCFHLGVVTYIQPVQWGGYTLLSTLTVHLVMMVSFLNNAALWLVPGPHLTLWLVLTDLALCWKGLTFLITAAEHSIMSGTVPESPNFRDKVLRRLSTSSLTSSSILTMNLAPPQYLVIEYTIHTYRVT